jgi:hypothetical protein
VEEDVAIGRPVPPDGEIIVDPELVALPVEPVCDRVEKVHTGRAEPGRPDDDVRIDLSDDSGMVVVRQSEGPVVAVAPRDLHGLAVGIERDQVPGALDEPLHVDTLVDLAERCFGDAITGEDLFDVEPLASGPFQVAEVVREARGVEVVGERRIVDREVGTTPGHPRHASWARRLRTGDQIEERLRSGLAAADHADPLAVEVPRPRHEVTDVELPVAEQALGGRRHPRPVTNSDGDVVGGHRSAIGPDGEDLIEVDGQHLCAVHDVLVLVAGPFQIVAELLAGNRVEPGVDEVVDPAPGMEVGEE